MQSQRDTESERCRVRDIPSQMDTESEGYIRSQRNKESEGYRVRGIHLEGCRVRE